MSADALQVIADRSTSDAELRAAVGRLSAEGEPASFWVRIANDPTYSARHRAVSVCQLFVRHMTPRVSSASLVALLSEQSWIRRDTVRVVSHLKGETPVEWNPDETVVAIRLFPDHIPDPPVLYLRISESVDARTFLRMLNAPAGAPPFHLLESNCVEPSQS